MNSAFVFLATPILSALLAFAGAMVADRFRNRVGKIESELERIDELVDLIIGIERAVAADQAVTAIDLTKLAQLRGRIGRNLASCLRSHASWPLIQTAIVNLSTIVGLIETAALDRDKAAARRTVLDVEVRRDALRGAVSNVVRKWWSWRALRSADGVD